MNSPKQAENFNSLLAECIQETMVSLLSRQVANAVYERLEKDYSISKDELPSHLDKLLLILEETFGHSVDVIGRAIAKSFYAKLGFDLSRLPREDLVYCAEKAKRMLKSS